MKKVPNSTQKTLVRAASRRMTSGDRRSAERPPVIAGAGHHALVAVSGQLEVGRAIAHQRAHGDDRDQQHDADEAERDAPAEPIGEARQERQEDAAVRSRSSP